MGLGVIIYGLSLFLDGLGIVNTVAGAAERFRKLSRRQKRQARRIRKRLTKASKCQSKSAVSAEEKAEFEKATASALAMFKEISEDKEALAQARRGGDAFLAYVNECGGAERRGALGENARGLFDELLIIVANGVCRQAETDPNFVPQALTDLLSSFHTLLGKVERIETTTEKTLEAVNTGNAAGDNHHHETRANHHEITGMMTEIRGTTNEVRNLIDERLPASHIDHERKVRFGSPLRQAAGFIGRREQDDLYAALDSPKTMEADGQKEALKSAAGNETGSSAVGGPVVVCGMRGVGKSQLAAAYARECEKARWPLVAWMDASTREALVTGLAELAHEMGIDEDGGEAAPEILASRCVTRLNSGEGDRLIVFDNVDDFDDLTGLVPHGQGLRVLVTTTVASPGDSAGRLIAVGAFTRPQSVDFIRERTGLDDDAGAARLAEALGDLPVALAQAAATIKLNGYAMLDEYLAELREYSLDEVVDRLPGDNYPDLVHAALRKAYESALDILADKDRSSGEEDLPRAATAFVQLAALALLAPSGVPRPWLHRIGTRIPIARQVLGVLVSHSICTLSDDERYVRIHGLQGRVLREDYKEEPDVFAVLKDAVVNLLKGIDMDEASKNDARRADALDMADQIRAIAEQQEGHVHYSPHEVCIDLSSVTVVVGETISCLTNMGRPQIALTLTEAVDMLAAILGRDRPSALATYNNLALAYMEAGDVSKAIDIFEALIPDLVGVLGPEHPDTLHTRGNLADAYREAESISKAIDMHETLLADRTRILGPDHPDTLNTRNNLAGAHLDAGDLQQAIDIYEALQTDQTRVLGSDHLRTLTAQNNLALAYQKAGNLRKAMDMFEALIPDLVGILGSDHPLTLAARNNLAAAYWEAGNTSKAINEYNALIPDLAYALGSDHLHTLAARNNLAYVYYAADNLQIAVEMYENLVPDLINVFGPNHPHALAAQGNLAAVRKKAQQASSPQADGEAESPPPPES